LYPEKLEIYRNAQRMKDNLRIWYNKNNIQGVALTGRNTTGPPCSATMEL